MTDPRLRTAYIGCAAYGVDDHERALAVGAIESMHTELEKLRTLAFDVDATLRSLKPLANRDARVRAHTIYQQLERARARSTETTR